jgi:hypothetical protein
MGDWSTHKIDLPEGEKRRLRAIRHRRKHRESVNAKRRKWREAHPGSELKYREATSEERRLKAIEYRHKNREKLRAIRIAIKVVPSLVGKHCSVCGTTKYLVRHHSDFSKPLDIEILCKQHCKSDNPVELSPPPPYFYLRKDKDTQTNPISLCTI